MFSLFPNMGEDLRRQTAIAEALLRQRLYRDSLNRPPCRQRALFSGMGCLTGQKDLIPTDGEMNEPEGT